MADTNKEETTMSNTKTMQDKAAKADKAADALYDAEQIATEQWAAVVEATGAVDLAFGWPVGTLLGVPKRLKEAIKAEKERSAARGKNPGQAAKHDAAQDILIELAETNLEKAKAGFHAARAAVDLHRATAAELAREAYGAEEG